MGARDQYAPVPILATGPQDPGIRVADRRWGRKHLYRAPDPTRSFAAGRAPGFSGTFKTTPLRTVPAGRVVPNPGPARATAQTIAQATTAVFHLSGTRCRAWGMP